MTAVLIDFYYFNNLSALSLFEGVGYFLVLTDVTMRMSGKVLARSSFFVLASVYTEHVPTSICMH